MKKNQLITILCIIIVIVAVVTFAAVKSITGNTNSNAIGETDTPPAIDINSDETDNNSETSDNNDAPDNNTDSPDVNDTPDNNPDTSDSNDAPDNNSETSDGNDAPSGGSETSGSITGSSSTGNTVTYNTSMPQSYKDFALTSGMSAKEAYDYLNDFLNSKYSILINKENKVGADYEPSNLVVPSGCDYKMESTAAQALTNMLSAARKDGYSDLILYSGYRTYASQKNKYDTRTQKYLDQGYSQAEAEAKAGEYIAPPGSSEHHTGLAADICSSKIVSKFGYLDDSFDTTGEFKWLYEHCAEYGFIMRYRKDAESTTGFLYEPWHYRYLGVDHAKACTALGVTYEEYHAMLVKLRDEAKADAGV